MKKKTTLFQAFLSIVKRVEKLAFFSAFDMLFCLCLNVFMKKFKKGPNPLFKLLSLVTLGLVGYMLYLAYQLDILPTKLFFPLAGVVLIASFILVILYVFISRRILSRLLAFLLVVGLGVSAGYGSFLIHKVDAMITNVAEASSREEKQMSLVVLRGSGISELSQIHTLAIIDGDTNNDRLLPELQSQASFKVLTYDSPADMAVDLLEEQVDAILLNEDDRGIIHDEDMPLFNTQTMVIKKKTWFTKKTAWNLPTQSVDVSKEPFTIFFSGNDNYGRLALGGRSDANMLVTVNPQTRRIHMTSIPRDSYVDVACDSEAEDCPDGQQDKFTHVSIWGMSTMLKTIEENYGVQVNYVVRLNFSSVVNLVDAMGGIDIQVAKGLAVDQFYSNSQLEGVHEGWNHLDGERALAYARERHAYVEGDLQRSKNQQQVFRAIIKKALSLDMIFQYGQLIDSMSNAFATNLSDQEIRAFMKNFLLYGTHWKFSSYTITGDLDMQYSPSVGDYTSVVIDDPDSVQKASDKIQQVLEGD